MDIFTQIKFFVMFSGAGLLAAELISTYLKTKNKTKDKVNMDKLKRELQVLSKNNKEYKECIKEISKRYNIPKGNIIKIIREIEENEYGIAIEKEIWK